MKKIVFFFVLGVLISFSARSQCSSGYTFSASQVNPFQINFSNISTSNGSSADSITYSWDFGDGQSSGLTNPIHFYSQPVLYVVCLTLTRTDSSGSFVCSDTFCDSITIVNNPSISCNPDFSWSTDTVPYGIAFKDTSTYQGQGTVNGVRVIWDFGDGSIDTTFSTQGNLAITNHTYVTSGNYTVCIEIFVEDPLGNTLCTDTTCQIVNVLSIPIVCTSGFSTSYSAATPQVLTFKDSSSVQLSPTGAHVDTAFWDFGDGSLGKGDSLTHTYIQAGSYTVCHSIQVYDSTGVLVCSDTSCRVIIVLPNVNNDFCNVNYVKDSINSYAGNIFVWNRSTPANNNTNFVNRYSWDFGDGALSNEAYPSHIYASTGDYTVCLTLTSINQNSDTCVETYCDTISVSEDGTLNNKTFAGFTLNVLNPETITLIENELSETQIFPNPASENITIRFSEDATGKVNWKITDVKGSMVLSGKYNLDDEINNISIDIFRLDAGMYILSIENGISVYHNKLEINRW